MQFTIVWISRGHEISSNLRLACFRKYIFIITCNETKNIYIYTSPWIKNVEEKKKKKKRSTKDSRETFLQIDQFD